MADMTVKEAGRRGGSTTSERHGHEFYEAIGRKGGRKTLDLYGPEFYEEIGRKGGRKVRDLIEAGKAAQRVAEAGKELARELRDLEE